MTENHANCFCGDPGCWDQADRSWVSCSWHGIQHGCESSVFFIHGRKIREQRTIPPGELSVSEFATLLVEWSKGLPNPRVVVCFDSDGDGQKGFWIEGEREPNEEDAARLEQCRAMQEKNDRRELERLKRKYRETV